MAIGLLLGRFYATFVFFFLLQVTLEEKPSALESDSLLENEEYEEDDSGDMVKSPVHNILTENQGHIGL